MDDSLYRNTLRFKEEDEGTKIPMVPASGLQRQAIASLPV
jgi:hypothetical protein